MQNPFQQNATNPMDGFNDPLAFVKKLWGDMQLPGMVTPTISVDELDKQIKDLKTVESWLNVNMTMLRGTIHALEVQRSTIDALKTMGESFAKTAAAHTVNSHMPHQATAASEPQKNAHWPMPEQTQAQTAAAEKVEEQPSKNEQKPAKPASSDQQSTAFNNPAAWWTVLQDQFKEALSTALKEEPNTSPSKDKKPATTTKSADISKAKARTQKPAAKTGIVKKTSKVGASTTKKTSPRSRP